MKKETIMYIKAITEIKNYRNLSEKTITFDRDVNFLMVQIKVIAVE